MNGRTEELKKKDTIQEETEEKSNVVPFKLEILTGGKGPPGNDWLSPLPEGTVFLTRPSDPRFDKPWMEEYHISTRTEQGMVCLHSNLNQEAYIWVDPVRFCRVMELIEVLQHGTGDWPDRDG